MLENLNLNDIWIKMRMIWSRCKVLIYTSLDRQRINSLFTIKISCAQSHCTSTSSVSYDRLLEAVQSMSLKDPMVGNKYGRSYITEDIAQSELSLES